jgi:thioredoxin reductase (NADPH)
MKDLIILGNGMAGMTAALYAKRANLDFKIVGRDEFDFGQIGNAILVENYPCAASQSGFDLAMKLHDQLIDNGIEIEEHTIIEVFRESDGIFSIGYENDKFDEAKSVIYALGARHRELNCKIEEGIPIHYCALCDGSLYKNKVVAVIGGGDVAFTEAEYLAKICKEIKIIMCDENVTAAPSTYERVKQIPNIQIIQNYPIDTIKRNGYRPYQIDLLYNAKPLDRIIVDGIFVAIGMIPNTEPLYNTEPLHKGGVSTWPDTLQSMYTPGLYFAGDVIDKKVRQSITAAADGAIAVNSVIEYLKRFNWNKGEKSGV